MAIINSYPPTDPTNADHLLGVRFDENGNPTKLFPLQGIIDLVEGQIPVGPAGPQGAQGIQGIQGLQGVQGVQGVQGATGDQGAQGTAGNSVTILGSYADLAAFNAGAGSMPGANIGDAWILLSDGSLMSWNGAVWFDAGDIKGPQGDQGAEGLQGIQGVEGDQGPQGIQGIQGPAGIIGLFAQTADSTPVTNTTVETTIVGTGVGTLTVPANGFAIGDSFTCALDGVLSCGSSATLHIRVKTLAGVILADTGIIDMSAATNKPWVMNLYFTVRTLGGTAVASISSGGLFSYIRNGGTQFEGYVLSTVNNTTFNTTVNNTLVITAQWNTATTGDSIVSKNFTLTKVY